MISCDVVVIGAGVAGGLIASDLARTGTDVVILEAGEEVGTRIELLRAYGAALEKTPASPYTDFEKPYAPSPVDYVNYDDYYVQPTQTKYKSTYERIVGGSTWHWLGHTPRLIPSDFKLRSRYGVGVDWPISYDDLEKWYCRAETEIGVAGDHVAWNGVLGATRSAPFPMSKIWSSYSDDIVAAAINGIQFNGQTITVLSTPAGRNSQPYDGRPPCAGNASCVPLCPIQAKYDATVHVNKARTAGATLKTRSVVTTLVAGADRNIASVRFKTWDGVEDEICAKFVVLAAHAIESAKMLLLSNLANESDQVGRNLMDHLQKSAFGMARQPLFPYRGPPSTSGIEVYRDGPERRARGAFRVSLDNDGWGRLNSPAADVQTLVQTQSLFGTELKRGVARKVARQLRLSCSTEVLPSADNRVTLAKEVDALGIPRPQLTFAPDAYTKAALKEANDLMAAIFDAVGDTKPRIDTNLDNYDGAGHILGTTRMGNDPKSSVVDGTCASHEHRNLFIVGSSVFPTSGTANPTLTVAALALRCAGFLREALSA